MLINMMDIPPGGKGAKMLRSINEVKYYSLLAKNGEIGQCRDFIFDDHSWTIRYMVADTSKWMPGSKVLISPLSLGDPDWKSKKLPVERTVDEIKDSPPLDSDAPISREYEKKWLTYWKLPYWWEKKSSKEITKSTLRSVSEVSGYDIKAKDKDIGHVEDFIVDTAKWRVLYMIVDTRNWLPGGKKVLISPSWIDEIKWTERSVKVDLHSDKIENSPEYDPAMPVNRAYESQLYDYYGRPVYWD